MNRYLGLKIWILTFVIISFGLVALYSASYGNVRVPQKIFYDQLFCAVVGFVLMFVVSRINPRRYHDVAYIFYGINILMLVMVMVKGHHALGATRWLSIGPVNIQPSELTKLCLILALARYFSNRRAMLSFDVITRIRKIFRDILWPFFLTLISTLLIFKQPDLGTSLLMVGIFIVILFVSEVSYKQFTALVLLGLSIVPFGWAVMKPYQKDRLLVFLNPNIDPLGAGYTIIQSKIAVGSGEFFGKGWLSGTQNQLNFLPERHTDFIFSVIGEEWGFLGTGLLMSCYFLLVLTAIQIAIQVKDRFAMMIVVGIVGIVSMQVIINIGMVVGLFPIVGLTLPLVSYGRSSFMVFIIMMGILVGLSRKRTVF